MGNVRFHAQEQFCALGGWTRSISRDLLGRTVFLALIVTLAVGLAVSACSRRNKSTSEQNLSRRVVEYGQPVPKGGGRYKLGSPYNIAGRWYAPREEPGYDKVGTASWYGDLFHGRYTANGEIFDMDALTAAHPTLPLPSYVRVTNLENGRALVLRVNDRGPYAHDRIIDLSRASAQALGYGRAGTARVRVQYLGPAPLNGDDSLERRVYASQSWTQRASLNGSAKRRTGYPRLAKAVQRELVGDPMLIGAIPKESANASWATNSASNSKTAVQDYFVQAASFNNREFAYQLSEGFAGLGAVKVIPANIAGKTWYRVRVGPYAKRNDADQALRVIVETGLSDARIVSN